MDKKKVNIYKSFGGIRTFSGDEMKDYYKCANCGVWVEIEKMEVKPIDGREVPACLVCQTK